jgi:hypothetical protein
MTEASAVAQLASHALWRAREAIRLLGDRSGGDLARHELAEAIADLRTAGVSIDDLAVVLSLPEATVRRLLLHAVR